MATLSSAEFRNQHRVVNELKYVAAAVARLRQSPTAAAKGEFVGAMRSLAWVSVSLPRLQLAGAARPASK